MTLNMDVLNQVLVLFIIMGAGYIARKTKVIGKGVTTHFSTLLIYVTSPLIVLKSFYFDFSMDKLISASIMLAFTLAIHLLMAIAGTIIFSKLPRNKSQIMRLSVVFSNCGYMGIPVIRAIYPEDGLFYISVFLIGYTLFQWTYGIMVFSKDKGISKDGIKKALTSPGFIAIFIGLVIFIFSIKLPTPVFSAISLIGDMTIPLSMIIVGSLLAEVKLKEVFNEKIVFLASFLRLLLIPAITYIILNYVFGLEGKLLAICVLEVAMPTATMISIFANKFGGDAKLSSKVTMVSTMLSIITIPLFVILLKI